MFTQGDKYTRDDVQTLLKVPRERRGGNWLNGYNRYEGSVYVFCNVGTAGRTGHDYANTWVNDRLVWFGRTGSTATQPLSKAMIEGDVDVHVFWRNEDRKPFTYAGKADLVEVKPGSKPVQITWAFD